MVTSCKINSDLKVPILHKITGKAAGTYTITSDKKIIALVVQHEGATLYNGYLINMDGSQYIGYGYSNSQTVITYNSDKSITYKSGRQHTLYYITEG